MNRERAKELLPIIEAFVNGKTIELQISDGSWITIGNPGFHMCQNRYRIKPEPKLVPLDFNDQICGEIVKFQPTGTKYSIISQSNEGIIVGGSCYSYKQLLQLFAFLDGKPCGKYVDE